MVAYYSGSWVPLGMIGNNAQSSPSYWRESTTLATHRVCTLALPEAYCRGCVEACLHRVALGFVSRKHRLAEDGI